MRPSSRALSAAARSADHLLRSKPTRSRPRQGSHWRSSPQRRPRSKTDIIDTGLMLAAVGRANVGKSTLFNRLGRAGNFVPRADGDAPAIRAPFVPSVVDSFPGVTRDARSSLAAIADLGFTLVDTAGLEDAPLYSEAQRKIGHPVSSNISQWIGPQFTRESMLTVGALDPDELYRALYAGMSDATVRAVEKADAALFVLDASVGVTPIDAAIARWLRSLRTDNDIIVLANKCDMINAEAGAADMLQLGLGDPVVLSAEHNLGMGDLYQAVMGLHEAREPKVHSSALGAKGPCAIESAESTVKTSSDNIAGTGILDGNTPRTAADDLSEDEFHDEDGELLFDPDFVRDPPIEHLLVSVVGRPNVGKSSLISRLTERNDPLVGPASGVTRDALLSEWRPKNPAHESLWVVDTAGIRDRTRVLKTRVEVLSVKSSLRALRMSHVAVIVVDASAPLTPQDVRIAEIAVTEGRAVVLVVNKIDRVKAEDLETMRESLAWKVRTSLNEITGVEVVEMSALEWADGSAQAARLYGAIQRARRRWEKRVPTSALTRYVTRFNETIAVGMSGAKRGRRGTTKFISQKKIRPPMFRLDGSSAVSDTYIRALTNGIRAEFGFEGVPIRIKRPSRRQRR